MPHPRRNGGRVGDRSLDLLNGAKIAVFQGEKLDSLAGRSYKGWIELR
jgi:hypothetical protein